MTCPRAVRKLLFGPKLGMVHFCDLLGEEDCGFAKHFAGDHEMLLASSSSSREQEQDSSYVEYVAASKNNFPKAGLCRLWSWPRPKPRISTTAA